MMGVTVLCTKCKHFKSSIDTPDGVDRCEAFPDGIPAAFMSGAELHVAVDEEQQGAVVFEKRDNVDQETVDTVMDNWDLMRAQLMYDALPEPGDGLGENR